MSNERQFQILKRALRGVLLVALTGCASVNRGCSSCNADSFGADWVVVQMDNDGRPYRCWWLKHTSVASESGDGVYWVDPASKNLVHISGHFNRVQVVGDNWARAYETLGLTQEGCTEVHNQTYDPAERVFRVRTTKYREQRPEAGEAPVKDH